MTPIRVSEQSFIATYEAAESARRGENRDGIVRAEVLVHAVVVMVPASSKYKAKVGEPLNLDAFAFEITRSKADAEAGTVYVLGPSEGSLAKLLTAVNAPPEGITKGELDKLIAEQGRAAAKKR